MRRLASLAIAIALLAACSGGDPSSKSPSPTPTTEATTTTTLARYEEEIFDDVEVTTDITYGSAAGVDGTPEDLKLDVYQPEGDTETDRPIIVYVHGGGFGFGDKAEGISPVIAPMFTNLGYVVASINYRLLAVGGCTGASSGAGNCQAAAIGGIHDGQAAVRFMRDHARDYRGDPDRIGIAGESAGAIIAMGAGVWSDVPGDSGTPGVSSAVSAWMSISGGLPGGLFVSDGDAPGLLFHGTSDGIVPYQWSADTDAAMKKAGVIEQLVTYDGAGHVPWREQKHDIFAKTVAFFRAHLVGA